MTWKLCPVGLAIAMFVVPVHAEERTCQLAQDVCDANQRAFACYVENARRVDDGATDVTAMARPIRYACDRLVEFAIARRWHAMRDGDPDAPGIDEDWKIASAVFLRKEGRVLHERWYDEEMDKIVSVVMQLRELRINRSPANVTIRAPID